jgi:HEPN/Toprim N-terminal domain 1
MDNEASSLFVGSLPVCSREEVDDELLMLFREDMAHVERVPAERYEQYASPDESIADALIFRAPGSVISDRLDVMGIDAGQVLADLDEELRYQASPLDDDLLGGCDEKTRAGQELLAAMNAQDWVSMLARTPGCAGEGLRQEPRFTLVATGLPRP